MKDFVNKVNEWIRMGMNQKRAVELILAQGVSEDVWEAIGMTMMKVDTLTVLSAARIVYCVNDSRINFDNWVETGSPETFINSRGETVCLS